MSDAPRIAQTQSRLDTLLKQAACTDYSADEVRSDQQVAGSQPVMVERVLSSVGRAAPLQGVGRGFEPLSTHHRSTNKIKDLERSKSFFVGISPPSSQAPGRCLPASHRWAPFALDVARFAQLFQARPRRCMYIFPAFLREYARMRHAQQHGPAP